MDHADHVALLRAGLEGAGPRWLEFGAGRGAFTLALLDLLGDRADVVALDRDGSSLERLRAAAKVLPGRLEAVVADFTEPLPFEPGAFDGVLMANSLHFVRDKEPVLRSALAALGPAARFVLVEYGTDRGNPWVPWPIGFASWRDLAGHVGLADTRLIGEVPSRFLGSIYAAMSVKPAAHSAADGRPAGAPTPPAR